MPGSSACNCWLLVLAVLNDGVKYTNDGAILLQSGAD